MKAEDELLFQKRWAKIFKNNKEKVLEYWQKYRYFDTILDHCKFNNRSIILDMGCGISTILHFLPGERFGIDPLAETYKTLYDYPPELNILKAKGENIPFKDNFFDVVFCSNALDHVDDIEKTNNEIYRVLKPQGHFILAVEFFKEKKVRDSAHPYCLLEEDIMKLTERYTRLSIRKIPWIGLREYADGITTYTEEEFLMILKKE